MSRIEFPPPSVELEAFGLKFSAGGSHISRTMMLDEIRVLLERIPVGSQVEDYRAAVLEENVLGKATVSTREKSLRHLRELYSLDEATPIFGALRTMYAADASSLPLLAIIVAWSRDPLLRATTGPVFDASEGEHVPTNSMADALEIVFPKKYSELNRNKVARNAASSWTQSGHLQGRSKKLRRRVKPSLVATTTALLLGRVSGYEGSTIFSNPWCRLLDLDASRALGLAQEAHRSGLLTMRAIGEIVEMDFPRFREFEARV